MKKSWHTLRNKVDKAKLIKTERGRKGKVMTACIKCREFIGHVDCNLSSICPKCATSLVGDMTHRDMIVAAKVGLDALIDEATGYQRSRPPNELSQRHKKYLNMEV